MPLSNRVQIAVSTDDMAFFASSEDTIIAKLEWYRAGDEVSDRQWQLPLSVTEDLFSRFQ
ncbi:hypothetical protein KF728_29565 [Candidatus Obscuribacterales bacterium]|nr:hypothetical protein [Candidatus Obscuribacterales bacterium]MBX3154337.1 hypothetical protein [Candidatus Obscuribacterales bacterium]